MLVGSRRRVATIGISFIVRSLISGPMLPLWLGCTSSATALTSTLGQRADLHGDVDGGRRADGDLVVLGEKTF